MLDDVAALLDLVGVEVGLSQEGQVQRLVPAMRVLVRAQSLLKDGDGPQRTSQHSPAATGHDPYFDLVHPVCPVGLGPVVVVVESGFRRAEAGFGSMRLFGQRRQQAAPR